MTTLRCIPFDLVVDGKTHSFTRSGTVWIGRADEMDLFMAGERR